MELASAALMLNVIRQTLLMMNTSLSQTLLTRTVIEV